MQDLIDNLTIGALAASAGVTVEAVRFYQRRNLMPEPERAPGSIRRYRRTDVARVRFIKAAQRIGFTLDEVAQLLQLEDGTRCSQAREIAVLKLIEVRQRLSDLQRIEAVLAELVDRCGSSRGNVSCPLIASIQEAA